MNTRLHHILRATMPALLFFFFLTGTAAAAAAADKRVILHYDNQRFSGFNNELRLKSELKKHFPDLNLKRYQLAEVELKATSRKGRAKAQLKVGSWKSETQRIPGKKRGHYKKRGHFKKEAKNSDELRFENESDRSAGKWRLVLNGDVKVQQVTLKLEKKRRYKAWRPNSRNSNSWQSHSWQSDNWKLSIWKSNSRESNDWESNDWESRDWESDSEESDSWRWRNRVVRPEDNDEWSEDG
ncbi:MAG: hypothetical protein HQL52_00945 [Magnetococcales bacterium]|nr:hypothetical protein [Magnetococcales bacterium]